MNAALPAIVIFPERGAPKVTSLQAAPAAIVTVYKVAFDNESNVAVSEEVGNPAPPPPPLLKDQFVVVELFQVPEPPTQK